ncbi:FeoA family protein [Luteithermobacter gelatinilyticus]|uniref:FeoA family protein n=1 Tax=Luteithermobacter gelatinilyticus TaxID=2582913 RepID=UPI001106360C|nr:FeoA family protein [Luteithermobacter gelatinilyticus]
MKKYLSELSIGDMAKISGFDADRCSDRDFARDLEDRLLEIGFEEGLKVEVLHEGPVGRDPMAVRVGNMTVGLRRIEADAVCIHEEDQQESHGNEAAAAE